MKLIDVGDIVGFSEQLEELQEGNSALNLWILKLLSKALRPLPEKFHGLVDVDTRYRKRYLDLVVNQEVGDTFKKSLIIQKIREYLIKEGFWKWKHLCFKHRQVELLQDLFETFHNALSMPMFLRIAPELHLKELFGWRFKQKRFLSLTVILETKVLIFVITLNLQ